MPTIGARRHAEKVQAWGVDAVIAQGQEGGGHTGADTDLDSHPGRVGGGGHSSRWRWRLSATAVAWCRRWRSAATGIAMGTRFLLTQESQVPDHVKQVYLETKANGTDRDHR